MAWPERPGRIRRLAQHVNHRWLAESGADCFESWNEIGSRLGRPQSILCLGNGPSSEDPALTSEFHDCLFRVNWVWHARAVMTRPQIVFTADPDLPPPQSDAILAFPTRSDAHGILHRYRRADRLRGQSYFVVPELESPLTGRIWPLRPTNGALMIATAAQLQPRRLVIAGIDLYQHPAGKYPGEAAEANDYDAIHSRDNDLDAIALALAVFPGEVLVIGDQLRAALAERAS
jgi:hypothetical protein